MSLFDDVRYAFRLMRRAPGFAATIIVTLALGIGANTTVFTLVNAVLFRPLPFDRPEQLMTLTATRASQGGGRLGVSWPEFQDWKRQAGAFQEMAAFSYSPAAISERGNPPERFTGVRITPNMFRMFGLKPSLGRDFVEADGKEGAPPVALIAHGVWKSRYGSDPSVIGRVVRINEVPTTIVGVMGEGIRFPSAHDVWLPLIPGKTAADRKDRSLLVFARVREKVTIAEARASLELVARQLETAYPATNKDKGVQVRTYNETFNGGEIQIIFLALLGAVGFVLLICCANVANLMLARALLRLRETSIRTALGASRWRVVRQLLVESVLYGLAGGLLGLALATQGVRAFDRAVAGVNKPFWIQFTMDWAVFGYLALVCIGTGLLFGLVPAIQASRSDLHDGLKESGRANTAGGRTRLLSSALVVVEVALAVVLLAGAGLMIRSFLKLYNMNLGIKSDSFAAMRLLLAEAKYPDEAARRQFGEQLLTRLQATPGSDAVTVVSHHPAGGAFGWRVELEGQAPVEREKLPAVSGMVISPNYFDALQLALERGRAFSGSDGDTGKEAVIVNRRFAAQYWPGQDPLGKRLRIHDDKAGPWLTVVAVAPVVRQDAVLQQEADPVVYVPFRQNPVRAIGILARTASGSPPAALIPALRAAVQELDQDLPVYDAMPLNGLLDRTRWAFSVFGTLFTVFAGIALVLSGVGIYGVMAYTVNQRTQEFGVRMALGASPRSILGLVMKKGVRQLGLGLGIGLIAALGAARLIQSVLAQTSAHDPVTFASIALLLLAAGLLACWLPARRATRVDPVVALRYE